MIALLLLILGGALAADPPVDTDPEPIVVEVPAAHESQPAPTRVRVAAAPELHAPPPATTPASLLDAASWDAVVPQVQLRGQGYGLGLLLLAGLAFLMARVARRLRAPLAPRGLLPTVLGFAQQAFRLLIVFFAVGAVAAVLPSPAYRAAPFAIIGAAVAIGWSLRDVLPDIVAGITLSMERRIHPGQWIDTHDVTGVVESIGVRTTWVRDDAGRHVALPNRRLLDGPVATDMGRWPSVEVLVRVPAGHAPADVRAALVEAVLLSPWAAPLRPELVREEEDLGRWRVRARVLEVRFTDPFEGALRERVDEVLRNRSSCAAPEE